MLVVDDEFSIRDITQQTLEASGYRVITASDGRWVITPCSLHPIATPVANAYSDESIEAIFTIPALSRLKEGSIPWKNSVR